MRIKLVARSICLVPTVMIALLCFSTAHADSFTVPKMRGPVMDRADILHGTTERSLESALRKLWKDTDTQLVVLTVPSLGGVAIEQASIEVVEQWQLGRKETDKGVLLLVAPQERRMRIEVGQGLEGVLTDAHAKRIIAEQMTPLFVEGDYDSGVVVGVHEILTRTNPNFDFKNSMDAQHFRQPRKRAASGGSIFSMLLPFLFWGILLAALSTQRSSRHRRGASWFPLGGGLGGGGFGGGLGGGFGGGGGGFSGGGASGGW